MGNRFTNSKNLQMSVSKKNKESLYNFIVEPNSNVTKNEIRKKSIEKTNSKLSFANIHDTKSFLKKLMQENLLNSFTKDYNLKNLMKELKGINIDQILQINNRLKDKVILQRSDSENSNIKLKELLYLFEEYQTKYLALNPKFSIDIGIQFIILFTETYHIINIYKQMKNEQLIHLKWCEFSDNILDSEYLNNNYQKIHNKLLKYFPNLKKKLKETDFKINTIDENNIEITNFIDNVFENALIDYNEKPINKKDDYYNIDNWDIKIFGFEDDNQAIKCLDYIFNIHMFTT